MNTEEVKKEPWVSQAQIEVWEWKEALSKEIENMTMLEAIRHIEEKSRDTVEKLKASQRAKAAKERTDNDA